MGLAQACPPDNYHPSSIANIEHAIHMQLAEIHTLENLPLASSFNALSREFMQVQTCPDLVSPPNLASLAASLFNH